MNAISRSECDSTTLHGKRRLAIFVPSMRGGGAERMMLNLSRSIAERGYTVDLVLAKAEGTFLTDVPKIVGITDLKASRVLTSLPGLIHYFRHSKPEAILSVMDHTNIVTLIARCLAMVPTRVIISIHNTLTISAQHGLTLRARFIPWLTKFIYPCANRIVAVSNGVADDLAKVTRIPREQIKVIYNPVITPELSEKKQAPLDHPWFGPGQPPVIIGVGRLREQKDFPTLIRAFAQVRSNRLVRLIILGEGRERPNLEALVRELGLEQDVSMPGFLANPYVFMARSRLFVLSSRWEGLPTVLIEALYCGRLPVSTDCPSGTREILDNGRYGRLVPVGDINAMARAIENELSGGLNSPPLESWQPFELNTVVDQYLDLLLEG